MKRIISVILTAGALLSVSAMFPTMTNAEESVGEFLNSNGEYQSVTMDDILAGNDTYTLFDGSQITFTIDTSNNSVLYDLMPLSIGKFTANYAPGYNDTPYSINNASYEGSATISANTSLYSNRVLNNGTASNMLLSAEPQNGQSLTDTMYNLYCYTSQSSSIRYATLSGGSTKRLVSMSNVPFNRLFYIELINSSSSTKNPFVSIGGY